MKNVAEHLAEMDADQIQGKRATWTSKEADRLARRCPFPTASVVVGLVEPEGIMLSSNLPGGDVALVARIEKFVAELRATGMVPPSMTPDAALSLLSSRLHLNPALSADESVKIWVGDEEGGTSSRYLDAEACRELAGAFSALAGALGSAEGRGETA